MSTSLERPRWYYCCWSTFSADQTVPACLWSVNHCQTWGRTFWRAATHPHTLLPPPLLCYIIKDCHTVRLGHSLPNPEQHSFMHYNCYQRQPGAESWRNWDTLEIFISNHSTIKSHYQFQYFCNANAIQNHERYHNTYTHFIPRSMSYCTLFYVHKEAGLLWTRQWEVQIVLWEKEGYSSSTAGPS